MVSFRWRRWLEKTFGTKACKPHRRREVRPKIEVLEDRWVPSITNPTGVTITPSEGSSFSGTVATFTGSPTTDTFSASIDWGDGITTAGTLSNTGTSYTVSGTHTYADEGTNNVTVSLTETGTSPDMATVNSTANVAEADSLAIQSQVLSIAGPEPVGFNSSSLPNGLFTFTDTNTANVAGDFTATINWGDGTTTTGTVSGSAGTFRVDDSHTYADEGSFNINATVVDDSPGTASASITAIPVTVQENDGLTGTGIPAATVTEGQSNSGVVATFTDTNTSNVASDFTATIDWGDGTTDTGSAVTISGSAGNFTVSGRHTYADEGNFTITATLTDDAPGTATAQATSSVTATEADSLNGGGLTILPTEGLSFSGTVAQFTDSNTSNVPSDFTATIDWGDGTTDTGAAVTVSGSNGLFNVSGSHTYAEDGGYQITTTLADNAPGTASHTAFGSAIVQEGSFTINGTPPLTATEGAAFSGTVATFSDPGSPDAASAFSATINWGDGTTDTGTVTGSAGSYTVTGSHTYADEFSGEINVSVSEPVVNFTIGPNPDSMTVAEADVLTVNPIQPTLSATEGQSFSGRVANFVNTNAANNTTADFTVTIDWGDGTTTGGVLSNPSATNIYAVDGTHIYADEGNFNVTVTVTDDVPGTATATATNSITVAEADSLSGTGATISATEGTGFSGAVATFTDTNPAGDPADFTASIDWGDGTTTTGTVSGSFGGPFTVSGDHAYIDEGTFSTTVTLTDNSPGTAMATANGTANVAEGDFGSLNSMTITATEGVNFSGAVASFTDEGNPLQVASDFTASIDWGDGTTTTGSVSGSTGGPFTISGSHIYTDEGTFTITASFSDDPPSTLTNILITSTANVAEGDSLSNTAITTGNVVENTVFGGTAATFSDSNTSAVASDFSATFDWGDGTTFSTGAGNATVSGSNGSFTVSVSGHAYADEGTFTVRATLTDDAPGTATASATGTLIAGESDILAGTASTITPTEGSSFSGTVATFTDTNTSNVASDFTATIDWGDGTTTAGTVTGTAGNFTVTGSHIYAEDGAYTTAVTLSDDAPGVASAIATGSATVAEGGLFLSITPISTTEGTTFNGTVATFTDPGSPDPAANYTATIDWGDGTTVTGTVTGDTGNYAVTGSHTYADEGTFNPVITVSETGVPNSAVNATSRATVAEGDSLSGTGLTFGPTEGTAFNGAVATFADTNANNVATDFRATIDWGDGTTTAGTVSGSAGAFTVSGSHTYADEGSFTTHIALSDDTPGTATASVPGVAVVAEGDILSAGSATNVSRTEGQPFSGQVATFTDSYTANVAGDFTATINWGDGATTTGSVSGSAGNFTVFGAHTYTEDGSFTIATTLSDDGAGTATATATGTATISEATLTATANNLSTTEGTAFSGTVGTFTDPGSLDAGSAFTVTIAWGDGSSSSGTITGSNGSYTVSGNHTYAENGSYTVTLTAFENNSPSVTAMASSTATVAEASLTVSTNAISFTEGQTFSGIVATLSDPGSTDPASAFTANIVWGDGTSSTGTVTGSAGSYTISGSHTFAADEGTFSATATAYEPAVTGANTASGTLTATVLEGDTLGANGVTIKAAAGSSFSGTVATFADGYLGNVAGDFSATINWGDGTTSAGTVSGANGSFTVSGTHTYANFGNFSVTVRVADDAPGTAAAVATSQAKVHAPGLSQKLQQQLIVDVLLQPLLHTGQGLSGFEFDLAALFGQAAMESGFSAAQQLLQNEFSLVFDLELQLLQGLLGQHDTSLQTKIDQLGFDITSSALYNTALGYDMGLLAGAVAMRLSVPS